MTLHVNNVFSQTGWWDTDRTLLNISFQLKEGESQILHLPDTSDCKDMPLNFTKQTQTAVAPTRIKIIAVF